MVGQAAQQSYEKQCRERLSSCSLQLEYRVRFHGHPNAYICLEEGNPKLYTAH